MGNEVKIYLIIFKKKEILEFETSIISGTFPRNYF